MPEVLAGGGLPGANGASVPDDWESEAIAQFEAIERRVAAQVTALRKVPLGIPVPADVLALLSTAPSQLAASPLPARYLPRAAALCEQVEELVNELERRSWELAGRIATVRAARRAGPVACTMDYES